MAEACPVCGDPFDYREDLPEGATSIEIDELCGLGAETRWNRICPVASDDGAPLRVFHHHFEEPT